MNKNLTVILVFIGTILVGAIILLLNQNRQLRQKLAEVNTSSPILGEPTATKMPDSDTENWKTFTNEKYGYSLEYPAEWEINKENLQKVSFNENCTSCWQGSFKVTVSGNDKNYTLDQWKQNYFLPLTADPTVNLAKFKRDTSLGGKEAKEFGVFQFDHQLLQILSIHNNNQFIISFAGNNPNDEQKETHDKIYNQILSTFKFLDSSETGTNLQECLKDAQDKMTQGRKEACLELTDGRDENCVGVDFLEDLSADCYKKYGN